MNQDSTNPYCAICGNAIEGHGIFPTSKGIEGTKRASAAIGDSINVVQGDSVHKSLRQSEEVDPAPRSSRSRSNELFDFKEDCLFCGTEVDKETERKKGREG